MSNFFSSCSFCLPRQCRLPKQAIGVQQKFDSATSFEIGADRLQDFMRTVQRSPVIFQVQIITDGCFLPTNQVSFRTIPKGAHDTAVALLEKTLYCLVGAIQHLPVILAGRQFLHNSLRSPSDHVRQDKRFIGRKSRADNVAAMKRCRECPMFIPPVPSEYCDSAGFRPP